MSDRRVIEVNPFVWQIILNLFILNLRPSKTAKVYKEHGWKREHVTIKILHNYVPKKLLDKIGNKNLIVDYAMRYGNPSIKSKIYKLHEGL